ncbi:MAG: hypothetical protein C0501_29070 [Isosphaera sp.]|nr:hypothetical protein [Isosphaera sp.]
MQRLLNSALSYLRGRPEAGTPRRQPARRPRLGLEQLEDRALPAVLSCALVGDQITITTDNRDTRVFVGNHYVIPPPGSQVSPISYSVTEIDDRGRTVRNWSFAPTPTAPISRVLFRGGEGDDRFVGNSLPTVALGGGGDDYLLGGDGNDRLDGGEGNDEQYGGRGNDELYGGDGAGNDRLDGGDGNDRLYGLGGGDRLSGGAGDDYLHGGTGGDWLSGGAGRDELLGGDGDDTLVALDDGTTDTLMGGADFDTFWADKTGGAADRILDEAVTSPNVNLIERFENGADRTLDGENIADPAAPGSVYANYRFKPLFASTGPGVDDVRQGDLNDCWLMATLGSVAHTDPRAILRTVVDLGDGSYAVRLGSNFYRVDGGLPATDPSGATPAYAKLGREDSLWVPIVEKAFAHFRTAAGGPATYASLFTGGDPAEAFRALSATGVGGQSFALYGSGQAVLDAIAAKLDARLAVAVGFTTVRPNSPAIAGHTYSVIGVNRVGGRVESVTVRNPWGEDGLPPNQTGSEGADDGYFTLTAGDLFGNGTSGGIRWGQPSDGGPGGQPPGGPPARPTVGFSAATSSGPETATRVDLTVALSAASAQPVTVVYRVTSGNPASGTDYTLAYGTLTFAPGETAKTIPVSIVNDALDEDGETIQVALLDPSGATLGPTAVHTFTIQDDDPPPAVSFAVRDSAAPEAAGPAVLTVSLSAPSGRAVTVGYRVTGGSAARGADYALADGTLTFAPGETTKTISVGVVNDILPEQDETIQVALSAPVNAVLGANPAHTYTIRDDDRPTGGAAAARHQLSAAAYQAMVNAFADFGYRPVWVDGYDVAGQTFFNAVFRPAAGPWAARHGLTAAQFQAEFNALVRDGFRLRHVDSYLDGGAVRYAAVWDKAPGPPWVAYHGLDPAQHQQRMDELTRAGWRPQVVSVVSVGGQRYHTALFTREDVGTYSAAGFLTPAEFQAAFDANLRAGRQLVYVNAYTHQGQPRFTAVWHSRPQGLFYARYGMTAAQYQSASAGYLAQGLSLRALSGYEVNGVHYFAAIWR